MGGVGAADGSGNQQAASPTRPLTHFYLPPAHFHPRPPGASLAFDLHHLAAAPHPHPRSAVGRRRRRRGRPGDRSHRRTRRRGRRGLLVHQGAILTMATLTMLPLLRLCPRARRDAGHRGRGEAGALCIRAVKPTHPCCDPCCISVVSRLHLRVSSAGLATPLRCMSPPQVRGKSAGPGAPPPTPAAAPPPPPPEAPSDLPEGWEEAPDPTTGTAAGRQVVRFGVGLARLGGAASSGPLVGRPGCSVGERRGGWRQLSTPCRLRDGLGSSGPPPQRTRKAGASACLPPRRHLLLQPQHQADAVDQAHLGQGVVEPGRRRRERRPSSPKTGGHRAGGGGLIIWQAVFSVLTYGRFFRSEG